MIDSSWHGPREGNGAAVRRRVLQIGKFYPPHMGGIETHLRSLCLELQGSVDVQAIVANTSSDLLEERVDGIRVTRLGTSLHFSAAPICTGLVSRLRQTPADVVHIHLPNPWAVLAFLASGHPGRLVVSYHSDVVRQRIMEPLFRPFLLRFLERADSIIVATSKHIDSSPILRRYRDRCAVIPYGVPVAADDEADSQEVKRIRDRFGDRLVLAVGRLVYYKGFEYLIRAMREVRAQLVLIGEGPMRAELEREVRASGVDDRVTFLGNVKETTPYYQAADVFVLPSVARSEAFGIVQLEAMACSTPVVNTRLDSGAPFVSLHNVSGLTVPPADSGALGRAITRVLDDCDLRAELGRAARRRVEEEFSQEVMGRRVLELYAGILGKPRGEPTVARGRRRARARPGLPARVS